MGFIWWFIPDQALPLVFIAGCLLLMLGWRGTGASLMASALLLPVLSPFVEAFMAAMPPWIALAILVVVALSFMRGLAALLLGEVAAGHMIGALAADVVRWTFLALFVMPFRLAFGALRAASSTPAFRPRFGSGEDLEPRERNSLRRRRQGE